MAQPLDLLKQDNARRRGSEHRRHPRYRLNLVVHIRLSSGELIKTMAVDISSTGVYVEYAASAEPGKVFPLVFDLSFANNFQRVYVKAEVVRSIMIGDRDVYGIAFRFVEFARDSNMVLKQYLEYRASRQII